MAAHLGSSSVHDGGGERRVQLAPSEDVHESLEFGVVQPLIYHPHRGRRLRLVAVDHIPASHRS